VAVETILSGSCERDGYLGAKAELSRGKPAEIIILIAGRTAKRQSWISTAVGQIH